MMNPLLPQSNNGHGQVHKREATILRRRGIARNAQLQEAHAEVRTAAVCLLSRSGVSDSS